MCYSGKCRFESGWLCGDCTIGDRQQFYEKYGETACIVGGYIDDEEAEDYIAKNKERLDAICEQWCKENLTRRIDYDFAIL